ncbi:unnamed protein product [Paramecium sonneborni]|uniref:Uncharacterized protein n=2 Tax=Paramecium sonneborni TaxID=65129 RepID=A0A8S1REP8_9CILI|nr:unnamed protein product [Paramecium sonneborni]
MSTKPLEEEIKALESKIGKMTEEVEGLDKYYADKSHHLFHLNTQIEGLAKSLKQRKELGTDKIKEQLEQEQVVLKKSQEQTDVKLRKTFQNFFTQQKTRMYLLANKSNQKMDVNSVAIFLLENPHKFVLSKWSEDETQDFNDGFSVTYKCVTFLIKKTTTIQQIFDWSVQYWELSRSEYTMVDKNCNCMDLLMNYSAENFFSAHKEQVQFACLYVYRKQLATNFLLDEQKINISLPNRNQQTSQDDENIKQIKKELDDFVEVQPGLKLYEKQDQEENQESTNISIGWKIFLLILSATLLILIYINSKNIMDYETTSQVRLTLHNYLLEVKYGLNTVSTIEDLYKKINLITIVDKFNVTQSDGSIQEEIKIQFQFIQMGPKFKVFQVQSSNYTCNEIEIASGYDLCYYSIYSDKNALKDQIVASDGQTYPWGEYKPAELSGVSAFSGILSDYDGGGFDESYDSYEYVDDKVQQHKAQGMFNIYTTKMVLFNIVIYDDSREQFYVIYYFFEIAPSYEIVQQLHIQSFRILKPEESASFWLTEYIMLAISGILNSIMIFVAVKEALNQIQKKYQNFQLRRDFTAFIQVGIMYQLTIFILQLISFMMFSSIPSDSLQVLQHSSESSIMYYANQFNRGLIIRGILIILVGFNTLKLFQISESVAFVQAMAAKGAENIIMIIIFAITILASYAFIFYQLFSQRFDEFTTYYRSFISTCGMFFLGNFKIWFKIVDYEVQTMIIITSLVFVTYTYGATVLVNAVLQEVYRTISYRTDHLQTIKEFYAKIDEIKLKIQQAISQLIEKLRRKNQ